MSIWDNMKKFAQPYNDDDFDDYDNEDEYMDDYEEVEEKPRRAQRAPRAARRAPEPAPAPAAPSYEDDDYEEAFNSVPKAAPAPAPAAASTAFSGRVLNVNRNDAKNNIVLFRPNVFNDANAAGDELKKNHPVIVNLEGVELKTARRVVDFLSGCIYTMDGSVKKIAQAAYLFCPNNVEISGDLESLHGEVEQYV